MEPTSLDPKAMQLSDAARLFSKVSGEDLAEETIRRDIEAGAPTNADGTINLVHYAAWLLKQRNEH